MNVPDATTVMGILNMSPDSFSGDGISHVDDAVTRAREMVRLGAGIVDVGGTSTRPGASETSAEVEALRILPVIRLLAQERIRVSVDTYRSTVAEQALAAGAQVVNDVSGGRADPDMARLIRDSRAPWVVSHWRAPSPRMMEHAHYDDVVKDVRAETVANLDRLLASGVDCGQIILDPGLGFAKTAQHNWTLLAHLSHLADIGLPVLVGASRKSFLGTLLSNGPDPRPTQGRDAATVALSTVAALQGCWGVRVHAVGPSVDAVKVGMALRDAGLTGLASSMQGPGHNKEAINRSAFQRDSAYSSPAVDRTVTPPPVPYS